ncbi:MAG: GNAT family N-acetyltransferase [Clostridium sp.]
MKVAQINREVIKQLSKLFECNPAKTIVEAVLKGEMGEVFFIFNVNTLISGMIKLGDFILIEGDIAGGEQYIELLQPHYEVISTDKKWYKVIKYHFGDCITNRRTVFNGDNIDEDRVEIILKDMPENCYLQRINENMARRLLKENWSRDLISNFKNEEEFIEKGIGFVLVDGMKVAAGASSFSVLEDGIEVEIDVNPNFRKKGYGYLIGAALINYCIKNNIKVHWDAMNLASAKIAKKIGFEEVRTYETLLLE